MCEECETILASLPPGHRDKLPEWGARLLTLGRELSAEISPANDVTDDERVEIAVVHLAALAGFLVTNLDREINRTQAVYESSLSAIDQGARLGSAIRCCKNSRH